MPFRCCVPKCKGNYPGGPKVSVFSFPKEEESKKKWLNGIRREDFKPSRTSKVSELHSIDSEIIRSTSVYDEKTETKMEFLSAPLLHPKLLKDAVPSQMIGYPDYLSKPATKVRESPEERRQRLESNYLQKALSESLETFEKHNKSIVFSTFPELTLLLDHYSFSSEWTVIKSDESVFSLF